VPLQHLQRYALRVSGARDGGVVTGPGPEWFITADTVAPTILGVPVVDEVDGGTFHVSWAPSTDDGEGRMAYESSFSLPNENRPGNETGPTSVVVPELRADLGPGTWAINVQVVDVVRNYGGRTTSAPFVIAADPSITPPSPPVPRVAIFSTNSISFNLAEPADVYHFVGLEQDGGVFAGPVSRLSTRGLFPLPTAYGYLPRECTFRVRASRLVDGGASEWSEPSVEFKVDLAPPTAPAGVQVSSDGGSVELSWTASTDSCSGVRHYRVERSVGSSSWEPLAAPLVETRLEDTPPEAGRWRYRVLAVDFSSHESTFSAPAELGWPPDSEPQPTAPGRYTVGCGCEGPAMGVVPWLAALLAGRSLRKPSSLLSRAAARTRAPRAPRWPAPRRTARARRAGCRGRPPWWW
jgi:hypothetical protein